MSNTTTLTGNIGKGELRYTQSGKAVYSFSVADNIGYGDNEKVQWVQCSIWGKRAENENLTSLLVKGAKVTVQGTLEHDPPTDKWKGGLKMPFVNEILHITPPKDYQSPKAQGGGQTAQGGQDNFEDFDSEIPFNHAP